MSAIRWNSNIQFPSDSCFVNRITDATFGPSKSSSNPMITLEMEVVAPETYDVAGQLVDIAGVKTTSYYTTVNLQDSEKSARALEACKELFRRLFPNHPERADKFNPENPDLTGLKGLCVLTQMNSRTQEQRKTPTAKQIEDAKKAGQRPEGDIMKHPVTGKPLIQHWPNLVEIFGVAPANVAAKATANKPY